MYYIELSYLSYIFDRIIIYQITVTPVTNQINLWNQMVSYQVVTKLLASAPNCGERPFVMEISSQAVKAVCLEQVTLAK